MSRITILLSMTTAFFFGGYKSLIGVTASADYPDQQSPQKSMSKIDSNLLPSGVKQSLEQQMEELKQQYADKNLGELIFGLDKNGKLQIIGTKQQVRDLKKSVEALQYNINVMKGSPPSSG